MYYWHFVYLRVIFYVQTSSDGIQKEVPDAVTSSYLLSADDIGYFVSVSCEPVRKDRARGPIVLSEQIGPISPGILQNVFLDIFVQNLINQQIITVEHSELNHLEQEITRTRVFHHVNCCIISEHPHTWDTRLCNIHQRNIEL